MKGEGTWEPETVGGSAYVAVFLQISLEEKAATSGYVQGRQQLIFL